MAIRNRITELRHVRAGDLAVDSRNWRRHPKAQRQALQTMLAQVGYADAVIARETEDGLVLIDGHLRAGLDPEQIVPVLVTDLDEAEAGQVLATLDPLAAMAQPDTTALDALVKGLAAQADEAMKGLLESMHNISLTPEPPVDPDAIAEPPAEPVSKRGDVWMLGRHRLMCGDSTDADDVARLLDGGKARLMVTDPPYGTQFMPSHPQTRTVRRFKNPTQGQRTDYIEHDERMDWSAAYSLSPSRVAYTWTASLGAVVSGLALEKTGYELRSMLVWCKESPIVNRGQWAYQQGLCWYAVKSGATAKWIGPASLSTVMHLKHDPAIAMVDGSPGHAAQKPVECMERPIRNHEGDVYDPFVGSGTTIIAADRQGRACYAMEIEPRYVDMAIARWEQYTGGKADRW